MALLDVSFELADAVEGFAGDTRPLQLDLPVQRLRAADLICHDGQWAVLVRRNAYRNLKSDAGVRQVPLSDVEVLREVAR